MGKLANITFEFADQEDDVVKLKVIQNNHASSFVQSISNSNNKFALLLQAHESKDEPVEFALQYTDSYHQEAEFWANVTLSLYIFVSDPPVFSDELQPVSADRCSASVITLPPVVEPDGQNFSVSLSGDAPGWVTLLNETSLLLNTTDFRYSIEPNVKVTVVLRDDTGAWSQHSFNVSVSPYTVPSFGIIGNISLSTPKGTVDIRVHSDREVSVID